ncbi:MAG: manganese catalase family protein [Oscillospiraceae bacterium]|nr:manganese catalase family protein [Oscillospiraceae bacterium]
MFSYFKGLQYPIKIKNPNPELAKIVITQYGGPNGKNSRNFLFPKHTLYTVALPFDYFLEYCLCRFVFIDAGNVIVPQ